jgi:hypothetical protein
MNMSDHKPSPRAALVRESLVFQLKLLADGLRDFVLVPVALVSTVVGLIRSGEEPDREFRKVLELGRETERMINLFGTHERDETTTDLDTLVDRTEALLRDQVRRGDVSGSSAEVLGKALDGLHARARVTGEPQSGEQDKDEMDTGEKE